MNSWIFTVGIHGILENLSTAFVKYFRIHVLLVLNKDSIQVEPIDFQTLSCLEDNNSDI